MFLNKIKNIKKELILKQKKPRVNVFEIFSNNKFSIIAELKKASPSLGDINTDINIIQTAKGYIKNGATALSVLTETEYFKGDINYISQIRAEIPNSIILNKDFILDEYQLYQAKILGADIVLLILALTGQSKTIKLINKAKKLGLEVLLEVHSEAEMLQAIKMDVNFIGVNNRNLKTLDVSLETSKKLSKYITNDKIFICESGLKNPSDVTDMIKLGYKGFLIGTGFMKSNTPDVELKKLIDGVKID